MSLETIARPADQLVTAAPTTPVREVARYMQEQAVGSVVVVDENRPVGIVTDRDLTLDVVNRNLDFETPVKEVMTHDPVTIDATAGVMDACRKMKHEKVRRLPVVEDGSLTGFLAVDDLIVLLQEELECLAEVIRYECPAR